jgi:hypothetical protein
MWRKLLNAFRASYANNRPFYQLGFILGAVGLFFVLVFIGVWWSQHEPSRVTEPDPLLLQQNQDHARQASLRRLVEDIYEAHGGRGALEAMNSFIRHGTLVSDVGEQQVIYTYKRPDKLSYTIDREQFTLRITFDGRNGWTKIVNDRGQRRESLLPREETEFLRKNTRMIEPITAFLSDLQALEWKDDAIVDDIPCYVVLWRGADLGEVRLYFAKQDLMVIKRERIDHSLLVDGEPERVAVVYSDHRRLAGSYYAYKESVYRQGDLLNSLLIDDWQINSGIMDRYFTAPAELFEANKNDGN